MGGPLVRTAIRDESLAAVVTSCTPLQYAEGADTALDRPAHVRAGSSLARTRDGMALIQDDANFVAIVAPESGEARAITLPAGEGGLRQFDRTRGNKKHKLDLEACFSIEEPAGTLLVALGSGSKSRRESFVLIEALERADAKVSLVRVPLLYEALRREEAFAGSQLNVEGAVHLEGKVRLFGRGNGAPRDGLRPVNATCDLDWPALLAHLRAPDTSPPPAPSNVVRYELGSLGGVALGFTDAARWRDEATIYSAAAEDSPDVVRDGKVFGSAIGLIEGDRVRWSPLTDASGKVFDGKVEGLAADERAGNRLFVVVDADDPTAASLLCTVELRGEWS